ncbi:hypothetical protein OHB12_00655 [Nocardia sp. NBC_01730]|nr:hypothetical protein OHB12_00655 [Nocardia sp. NBC_01730]
MALSWSTISMAVNGRGSASAAWAARRIPAARSAGQAVREPDTVA